jgi:electron transport complex protein RnfD
LPATVPWYVPVVGAFCAIILGKALFGGVGHFLWQPALVGRLAAAVVLAPPFWPGEPLNPPSWPVLAQSRVILGDIRNAKTPSPYVQWRGTPAPAGADALAVPRPVEGLRELVLTNEPPNSIVTTLRHMPPAWDLICGACGGGIGETCAIAILLAGLYLVYRNYVQGQLPGLFVLGAAIAAAVAPLPAPDGQGWRWLPFTAEGADVGFTYVAYHLFSGELLLAAWFFATEMTSRPITAPAQGMFGLLCGVLTILLRLYTVFPAPAYGAVLLVNTLTPLLDGIRPRVFGRRRWWQRWGKGGKRTSLPAPGQA